MSRGVLALAVLLTSGAGKAGEGRYVETRALPDGRAAVVAEGDLEPRSIGSYSVRLYGARNKDHPTDDFLGGAMRPRNGTIEKVETADVDRDGDADLVVVIRNAGTGSYLSADAFDCTGDRPVLVASVADLANDADATLVLRQGAGSVTVTGEGGLRRWHKITLNLDGPSASETGDPNPFRDYRMDVTFRHPESGLTYVVPGYFAADGNAADTSATEGNAWRAHLSPDHIGTWMYAVSFRAGRNAALADRPGDGASLAPFDGVEGSFTIEESDKTGRDFRGKGRLQYVDKHHLRFAGTGEYFLKCGADAPENLFAYRDFDGPFKSDGHQDDLVKTWEAHAGDWRPGDPAWQGGKGKGLIGAVNYLAGEGMNAFSFIPMNIGGDDRNVFPYLDYDERFRMDVSRLDQWERVFAHADRLGMHLHFKTQETENELLLDRGDLGPQRRLYYRELIARFAHHLALNWNLGEEIDDATAEQKQSWADYLWRNDPYRHPVVIHNGARHYDLLGHASRVTGFSLQTSQPDFGRVHGETLNYIRRSAEAGKPWVVACDEPGDAQHALRPDHDAGTSHEDGRKNALWGNLMAGGAGVEFYFGYQHEHSDLTCQDFRSRDRFWDYGRHALAFFKEHDIPFWAMSNRDDLVSGADDYCLAGEGIYVVYLKNGGAANLDLSEDDGVFEVWWFNPREGGALQPGTVREVEGGGERSLGEAPGGAKDDGVALVRRRRP